MQKIKTFRVSYLSFLALVFILPLIIQTIASLFKIPLWFTIIFERLHILTFILFGLFFIIHDEKLARFVEPMRNRKYEAATSIFFTGIFLFHYFYWRFWYMTGNTNWVLPFLSSSFFYVLSTITLSFVFFGILFWKRTFEKYKMKLAVLFLFIILYAFIKRFFENNWIVFSNMVNQIAAKVLSLRYDVSTAAGHDAPFLAAGDFAVTIARDCSGVESALLFLFLFGIVLFYDNQIKRGPKCYALIVAGIAGAFLITALRVIILTIVGIEISADFAITSFHANIGWVLFVIYVFIFYALLKRLCPASLPKRNIKYLYRKKKRRIKK